MAGLQVGRPVGVLPPWGVIAVAAGPWAPNHYGLECFWHSLVTCWPSVALLHDHICVCSVYHCS